MSSLCTQLCSTVNQSQTSALPHQCTAAKLWIIHDPDHKAIRLSELIYYGLYSMPGKNVNGGGKNGGNKDRTAFVL